MALIAVKYGNFNYPQGICAQVQEVAGHFDVSELCLQLPRYSLHTEYSYSERRMNSRNLKNLNSLISNRRDGIPQLWYSKQWAEEFAEFIFNLVEQESAPEVIEIHPPFSDYSSIERFTEIYAIFEEKIKGKYDKSLILVENRSGSKYRYGNFVISKVEELGKLIESVKKEN